MCNNSMTLHKGVAFSAWIVVRSIAFTAVRPMVASFIPVLIAIVGQLLSWRSTSVGACRVLVIVSVSISHVVMLLLMRTTVCIPGSIRWLHQRRRQLGRGMRR